MTCASDRPPITAWRRLVVPITCVLSSLLAGAPLALGQVPAQNLLIDPDAESAAASTDGNAVVPIPGWSTTGGFTASQYGSAFGVPAVAGGGLNVFAGGPANASSTATQTVDLSALAATIDRNGLELELASLVGGFAGQSDAGTVSAVALSATGAELGRVTIGPVTAADRQSQTTLLPRSATGAVPVGTRAVRVDLIATRSEGFYNDAYFDNLSLRLIERAPPPPPPPLPPAPNLQNTIPSPQTVTAGPTKATAPSRISLRSLRRSKCVKVVVVSRRPALVLATIFSGRRSIRLFGQKEVRFVVPGRRVICIPVPRRAHTFNIRTPLSFALGYRLGAGPAPGGPRPRPVIRGIRLVP